MDPLPEDAWELLGLDPDAARERDVKRAYARLIKIHRPDADPDNFRRVHEAYREALAWLKECEAEGDASEIFSDEIAFEYENPARPEDLPAETACEDAQPLESQRDRRSPGVPPALPASFASARNALADALENPDKTDLAGPFAAFRQASLAGADLTCQWVDALEGWAEMHFVDLARQLSSDDVLRLIDACRGDLPRSVMDFWHSQADYRRLVALAKLLLARVPPPDHPVAVFCMAQLAGLLAFSHANGAEKLADKAYPHLPPGSREWVMERLDRRLAAGKHFRGLDPRQARFWEHRLFDAGDETFDWSTPSAQAALSYLTMNRRSDWSGLPMIRSVVPELIFSDLERRLRRRGASAPGGQRVRPIPSKKSRWIWSVLAVLILLANFLVDGLRRKPGQHGSDSSAPDLPAAPAMSEESRRRAQDSAFGERRKDPLELLVSMPNATEEERAATVLRLREANVGAARWVEATLGTPHAAQMAELAVKGGVAAETDALAVLMILLYDETLPIAVRQTTPQIFAGHYPVHFSAMVFAPFLADANHPLHEACREAARIAIGKIPKDLSHAKKWKLMLDLLPATTHK